MFDIDYAIRNSRLLNCATIYSTKIDIFLLIIKINNYILMFIYNNGTQTMKKLI